MREMMVFSLIRSMLTQFLADFFFFIAIVITRDQGSNCNKTGVLKHCYSVNREKKKAPQKTRPLGLELTDTRLAWIKCPQKVEV